MLRTMRKHGSRWVLGFLIVIISVVFVFTFGFSNKQGGGRVLTKVGSHSITAAEYQETYTQIAKALRAQSGGAFDENRANLKQLVMNQLVDKYLLLDKAKEMGVGITDRQLRETISAAFSRNGKFDQAAYMDFVRSNSRDVKTFEDSAKQDMVIQAMKSIIMDIGASSIDEKAAYEDYVKRTGEVKLAMAVFDPESYKGSVAVDDKELAALYDKEKDAHRSENTYHLIYMVIGDGSGVKDDQAYMDLLKSKDLAQYGRTKGLEVVDLGTVKESGIASRFGKLKLQEALKGLKKGDVTLPIRDEGKSYIFQVLDREDGKALPKEDALKAIRARVTAEKARVAARMKAEEAITGKGLAFTKDTGFLPRSARAIPGIGAIPAEAGAVFALSKDEVFGKPVEIDGKYYVLKCTDQKRPDMAQWDKEKDSYRAYYAQAQRDVFFMAFRDELRKAAKVKIDWEGI